MNIVQVKNPAVWKSLKVLFMAAPLIFLINIYFGFDNALTAGAVPRWQLLTHLHAGSVGWITLSAIGVAVWVLTGQRDVSAGYEKFVTGLIWAAVIAFGLYVPLFGLAFSRPGGLLVTLHPVLGAAAVIILWTSAIYALIQLGKQSVTTTYPILAATALLVAAIGATMGALLSMERVVGQILPIAGSNRVETHASMMGIYLFLVSGAIIEWFTVEGPDKKWSIWGLLQALIWGVSAPMFPVAFFLNAVDQMLPILTLSLLLGAIIFLARVGWRALRRGPGGLKTWPFMGTIWLIVYLAVVVTLIVILVTSGGFNTIPAWMFILLSHSSYVGMMTNLILGVLAVRSLESRNVLAWGEPAAAWLINLGIPIFIGLKAVADIRYGAFVMGIGVLLGVLTMLMRLRASQ